MSSHHIVREKQEPALYIHHLGDFNEEYLGQLLEWSPTLIVNSSAYEKIISLGLKADVVISSEETHFFQENTKVLTPVKEDLDTVLEYLITEKYPAVNIIDASSNLHGLENYITKLNIVIFTDIEKTYPIKPGFKVWKPRGSVFRIAPTSVFEASNLKAEKNGSFKVVSDGFVEFNFAAPYLFISEGL